MRRPLPATPVLIRVAGEGSRMHNYELFLTKYCKKNKDQTFHVRLIDPWLVIRTTIMGLIEFQLYLVR